jgi:hypothetical protein
MLSPSLMPLLWFAGYIFLVSGVGLLLLWALELYAKQLNRQLEAAPKSEYIRARKKLEINS